MFSCLARPGVAAIHPLKVFNNACNRIFHSVPAQLAVFVTIANSKDAQGLAQPQCYGNGRNA